LSPTSIFQIKIFQPEADLQKAFKKIVHKCTICAHTQHEKLAVGFLLLGQLLPPILGQLLPPILRQMSQEQQSHNRKIVKGQE